MKKFYALLCLGIINACYGLGMYIESCSFSTDEWGYHYFDSNFDYFIWFISGVIIIILSVFIYKENKTKTN